MPRAIAIAANKEDAFASALHTAKNSFALLAEFMYGTKERTQLTYGLVIALMLVGYQFSLLAAKLPQFCPL